MIASILYRTTGYLGVQLMAHYVSILQALFLALIVSCHRYFGISKIPLHLI
ncbi:hypothetical protein [Pajaroellobacter abortibovis]|nr:hypothetical protein [Pajaroellobacter abortibovis]